MSGLTGECEAYHKSCKDCGKLMTFIGKGLFECWACTAADKDMRIDELQLENLKKDVRIAALEREAKEWERKLFALLERMGEV